jgi:hypothetical protein
VLVTVKTREGKGRAEEGNSVLTKKEDAEGRERASLPVAFREVWKTCRK